MPIQVIQPSYRAALLVAVLLAIGSWTAAAEESPSDKAPPHLRCYQLGEKGGALNEPVTLTDQFKRDDAVAVKNPHFVCAPVTKEHCTKDDGGYKEAGEDCQTYPAEPDDWHFLCWKTAPAGPSVGEKVSFEDSQFAQRTVKVQTAQFLCEPVRKKKHHYAK